MAIASTNFRRIAGFDTGFAVLSNTALHDPCQKLLRVCIGLRLTDMPSSFSAIVGEHCNTSRCAAPWIV